MANETMNLNTPILTLDSDTDIRNCLNQKRI